MESIGSIKKTAVATSIICNSNPRTHTYIETATQDLCNKLHQVISVKQLASTGPPL